jgi:trimeric autotransporter adhesin
MCTSTSTTAVNKAFANGSGLLRSWLSKFCVAFSLLLLANVQISSAQTPVPMGSQPGLTYTENFADIANWTNNFAAGVGANRWGSVAINATGTIPDGVRTTVSTATFSTTTSGGVQRGTGNIVQLSTGATNNTSANAIDFFLDFTGVNAGTLSFDWATVFNSTGDRASSLRVYTSTNGVTFTELTAIE